MNAPDVTLPVAERKTPRVDHVLIAEMVEPGSRVLDVGCGDGELLQLLGERRGVDGRGVELQRDKVNACVARGLSVIQGDADHDLDNYPDQAFDYAILSLTIQATRQPKTVLENLLRIGRHAIVSFPNFGHWRVRTALLFGGRMPLTANLPDIWYLTPNAHLCTIRDFAGRSGGRCRCRTCWARKRCSYCTAPSTLELSSGAVGRPDRLHRQPSASPSPARLSGRWRRTPSPLCAPRRE
jgi:methionine biosynthesis protein MetW